MRVWSWVIEKRKAGILWDEVTSQNTRWSARCTVPITTPAASASNEGQVWLSRMLAGPEAKLSVVVQLRAGFALGADFAQIYCALSSLKAVKVSACAAFSWMGFSAAMG